MATMDEVGGALLSIALTLCGYSFHPIPEWDFANVRSQLQPQVQRRLHFLFVSDSEPGHWAPFYYKRTEPPRLKVRSPASRLLRGWFGA